MPPAVMAADEDNASNGGHAGFHWSVPYGLTMTVPFMNRWRSQKYRYVPALLRTAE